MVLRLVVVVADHKAEQRDFEKVLAGHGRTVHRGRNLRYGCGIEPPAFLPKPFVFELSGSRKA